MTGGWRRSSYCAAGDCLEVRLSEAFRNVIELRRIKGESFLTGVLAVTRAEWDTFIKGVKAGEFDDLTGETPQ
jgi:Domain of unknown function (DUF397)